MLPPSKASRIAAWSANIKADGDDFPHDDDTISRDSRDSGPLRSALKGGRARAGANPCDLDDVVEAFEPLTTNRAAKFYANWVSPLVTHSPASAHPLLILPEPGYSSPLVADKGAETTFSTRLW